MKRVCKNMKEGHFLSQTVDHRSSFFLSFHHSQSLSHFLTSHSFPRFLAHLADAVAAKDVATVDGVLLHDASQRLLRLARQFIRLGYYYHCAK